MHEIFFFIILATSIVPPRVVYSVEPQSERNHYNHSNLHGSGDINLKFTEFSEPSRNIGPIAQFRCTIYNKVRETKKSIYFVAIVYREIEPKLSLYFTFFSLILTAKLSEGASLVISSVSNNARFHQTLKRDSIIVHLIYRSFL